MAWRLDEWNGHYGNKELPPMSQEEIDKCIEYLRGNNYPKPEDCPETECPKVRPACHLGICQIAAGMCGDF